MEAQRHVVVLLVEDAGHVNPMVPVIHSLVQAGCKVTAFAAGDQLDGKVTPDTALGKSVMSAGATLMSYRASPSLEAEPLLAKPIMFRPNPFKCLPTLVEDIRALQPAVDLILYDVFLSIAKPAAHLLRISDGHVVHAVGLVPHCGPGCMADAENDDAVEQHRSTRQWLQATYELDLFEMGIPPFSWYSQAMNIVTTCDELYSPLGTEKQRALFGDAPFRCVGSLASAAASSRPPQPDFQSAFERIQAARSAGRRIVLLSLGSMVTGKLLWGMTLPIEFTTNNYDTGEHGGKRLSEMTGRDFAHMVWRAAYDALGGDHDFLVVMATGASENWSDGLPPTPSNFMPCKWVPQVELLPLCDAFVTHGGMGSLMESIVFRVPVAVVPLFGDQPLNADAAAAGGFGVSFRYPVRTVHADAFGAAVRAISARAEGNEYRAALDGVADRMEAKGGAGNVVSIILSQAADGGEHK